MSINPSSLSMIMKDNSGKSSLEATAMNDQHF